MEREYVDMRDEMDRANMEPNRPRARHGKEERV
jgi:hypothetical protein